MTNSNDNGSAPASADDKNKDSGVALLVAMRRMMPLRRLAYWEHLIIAERQATRLRSTFDQTEPGAGLEWLTDGDLDNVAVVLSPRWKMEGLSGITTWEDGRWVIGVNKGNPQPRRRFTLCHEFKHVLDANREKITYQRITDPQRERIADYFAACYLMPKTLLRRAWTSGIQDTEALAGLFKVAVEAMERRLKHLQFIDNEPDLSVGSYFRRQRDRLRRAFDTGPWAVDGHREDEHDEAEAEAVRPTADAA
jgi:IrrE N-terminal-like domain